MTDPATAGAHPRQLLTLLFVDFPAAARGWERDPEPTRGAYLRIDARVRDTAAAHGGTPVDAPPHDWAATFPSAAAAVAAAFQVQRATGGLWPTPPTRVAVVAGAAAGGRLDPLLGRARCLAAAGHPGQVLMDAVVASYAAEALPAGAELRDLGERRIPDFEHQEGVFLGVLPALPHRFPPLESADRRPHNLPFPATALVGRQAEVDEVGRLLREEARLVTLLGPGGVGKTRLAVEVAWDALDEYADGVRFVDLADAADPLMVAAEVARALRIPERRDQPPEAALVQHLHGRDVLLVLDNLEQVLPEAAASAARLLRVCPKLKVLATSRIPLHVDRGHEVLVEPLAVPGDDVLPLEQLHGVEAVRLFVERARLVRPSFALTEANAPSLVAVLRRLGGLPLAIELAAPWVRILSPAQMLARLEQGLALPARTVHNLPVRHHSLWATIQWSYDLLADDVRPHFRRLAVFVGGFTAEAAERVARAAGAPACTTDNRLQPLIEASLLRETGSGAGRRLRMLEPIREFALERLAEEGEEAPARDAHAAYVLAVAEGERAPRADADGSGTVPYLDADLDDVRQALGWLEQTGRPHQALRLAAAASTAWERSGRYAEGRERLGRALATAADAPPGTRADALHRLGALVGGQGDTAESRALLEQALALYRRVGDWRGMAEALAGLGDVANRVGDHGLAELHLVEGLALYREHGEEVGVARFLRLLGTTALFRGEFDRAVAALEESRALAQSLGSERLAAAATSDLGEAYERKNDIEQARTRYQEALEAARRTGDRRTEAGTLVRLGRLLAGQGRPEQAARLAAEGLDVAAEAGDRQLLWVGLAVAARAALAAGMPWQAARLLGAAEAVRTALGASVPAAYRPAHEELRAALRERLGEQALASALADGGDLPVHRAIREAARAASS